jgi:hypothetical protein
MTRTTSLPRPDLLERASRAAGAFEIAIVSSTHAAKAAGIQAVAAARHAASKAILAGGHLDTRRTE